MRRPLSFAVLLTAVALAAGCKDEAPRSYRAPKEEAAPASGMGMGAGMGPGMAAEAPHDHGDSIHWKVPKGWEQVQASGMRFASFQVPGPGKAPGDMSVIVLPGDAGGYLANINRWRGQIGLEPVDEKALAAQVKKVKSPAGTLQMVDYAGPQGRLLAAILNANGQSWFFKLTGDAAVVDSARGSFDAFIKSLDFAHAH